MKLCDDAIHCGCSDHIEELEAEVKSMALDYLVASGQASDAYQAQLAAEAKLKNQTQLIEQFFTLMDITEQTDEGRDFKPNRIYSSRVMDAEKLEKVLAELKGTLNKSNFDIESLDPDERSWYYDGDGTKRKKE